MQIEGLCEQRWQFAHSHGTSHNKLKVNGFNVDVEDMHNEKPIPMSTIHSMMTEQLGIEHVGPLRMFRCFDLARV